MSKNNVHQRIPQNNQMTPQTYGDVNYKVTTSDYTPSGAPPPNLLFTSSFALSSGKGGGGGGGNINGDVMHTDTYAKFVDIVGEGPIVGPVNGLNSVLLNGTPLTDKNGNFNFKGVQVYPMYGTEDQKFPPMFQKSGSTFSVNAEVKKTQPYTFTITDNSITSVNIIMRIPVLSSTDDSGNINGTSVSFQFSINGNSVASKTISGIATSPIEQGFVLNLRDYTGGKTIVVTRITADSGDPKLTNKTFVASYTNIIDYTINYANRAGCALMFEAAQFGTQLPDRSYHVQGINTIKIPVNYNPVTRTYTGVWNGVFTTAYTNNPVWCMYDLLTNGRYGLGDYIDADHVDKYELYELAQYCDEMVVGLDGKMEPRFTFNGVINEREQALSILKKFQNNFLGVLYYFGGVIKIAQDKPADPIAMVTNANVVDGVFDYSTTELDNQTNTVVVSYNDPVNNYRLTTETVYNNTLLSLAGREVKKEVNAFGCTSRSQAHRLGKYILLSDIDNADSVTYTAGMDHAKIMVGDVIEIHDNNIQSSIAAGRIKSMSGLTINLDRAVTFIAGLRYTIKVLDQNGEVQDLAVSTASVGNLSTITVDDNKGFQASDFTIFAITQDNNPNEQGELYRIVSVKENDLNKYDIIANKYVSSKYEDLYSNNPVDVIPEEPLKDIKAPQGLQKSSQSLFKSGNTVLNDVDFTWSFVSGATHYEYQYRIDSNEFTQMQRTNSNQIKIVDTNGVYDVRVRAVDMLNRASPFSEIKLRISTGDIRPEDVKLFTIHRSGSSLIFTWEEVSSQQLGLIKYYEIRQGSTWNNALPVFRTQSNSYTYTLNTGGTFLIKAISVGGSESAVASSANAFPADTNIYITDEYAEHAFPHSTPQQIENFVIENLPLTYSDGTDMDMSHGGDLSFSNGASNRLKLAAFNYGAWYTLTDQWTTYTKPWASEPYIGLTGVYETDVKDLGAVEDVFIHARALKSFQVVDLYSPDFSGIYVSDLSKSWYAPGIEDASSLLVEMRYSSDGVTYTSYSNFIPGQYQARYFQYKVTMAAKVMKYNMYLDNFVVEYDIPDIIDRKILTTGANGEVVYTYEKTFHTAELVVLGNPTDPSTNVSVQTLSKSLTQATFKAVNQSTGAAAPNVSINIMIKGY
jgi:predicted phage tail protein